MPNLKHIHNVMNSITYKNSEIKGLLNLDLGIRLIPNTDTFVFQRMRVLVLLGCEDGEINAKLMKHLSGHPMDDIELRPSRRAEFHVTCPFGETRLECRQLPREYGVLLDLAWRDAEVQANYFGN